MTWHSMRRLREANADAGKFFFSRGAMRFFNTRIETKVIGGWYFVTSEQYSDETPRLFTVRKANEDGSEIDTIGEFQAYETKADAKSAIARLVDQDRANAPTIPGEYETPARFVSRVAALVESLEWLPGSDETDPESRGTDSDTTLTNGHVYDVSVTQYRYPGRPGAGHIQLSFQRVIRGNLESDVVALRDRGAKFMRRLLGDEVKVHASVSGIGSAYLVQGWSRK